MNALLTCLVWYHSKRAQISHSIKWKRTLKNSVHVTVTYSYATVTYSYATVTYSYVTVRYSYVKRVLGRERCLSSCTFGMFNIETVKLQVMFSFHLQNIVMKIHVQSKLRLILGWFRVFNSINVIHLAIALCFKSHHSQKNLKGATVMQRLLK